MNKIRFKEIHYGWFIVGAAFLIMAAGWGILYNCSSLFIEPISSDLGFSRSQINATMTIRAASQMVISLLAGKIFRRFDLIRLMKTASLVLVLSFFMYSLATPLWIFYLIALVSSVALTLISILPLSIILSNWFDQGRGTALGIAFMGSGVGGMIFSALTGIWIEGYGWRVAYQILALLMALLVIPCVFFVLKVHPKDKGLTPYGMTAASEAGRLQGDHDGITLHEAMRSPRFWILNLCGILLLIVINALMMNVAPHLTQIGYSITFSANVVALIMGSLAVGKVILGKLFDRIGIRGTTLIACLSCLFSLIGLVYAQYTPALVIVVLFVGVGSAHATLANSVLTLELFGRKDYNAILGFLTAIAAIGSMISPMITGLLYDMSGDYYSSFQFAIVCAFLATVLYWLIFSNSKQARSQSI